MAAAATARCVPAPGAAATPRNTLPRRPLAARRPPGCPSPQPRPRLTPHRALPSELPGATPPLGRGPGRGADERPPTPAGGLLRPEAGAGPDGQRQAACGGGGAAATGVAGLAAAAMAAPARGSGAGMLQGWQPSRSSVEEQGERYGAGAYGDGVCVTYGADGGGGGGSVDARAAAAVAAAQAAGSDGARALPSNPLRGPVVAAATIASPAQQQAGSSADPSSGAAGAAAAGPAPAAEPGAGASKPVFGWFAQWYAVAPLDSLDATRPHPFTLLVRQGSAPPLGPREHDPAKLFDTWASHTSKCTICLRALRRLQTAALAAGLLAAAAAALAVVSAAARASAAAAAAAAVAAGAAAAAPLSLPLLAGGVPPWVWAGVGVVAAAVWAAVTKEDGSGAPGVESQGWTFRDLAYGHTYFIENGKRTGAGRGGGEPKAQGRRAGPAVVDPAHVPVSHHKVAGDRYKDPRPLNIELSRPLSPVDGFEIHVPESWRKDVKDSTTGFVPPGHVRIQQNHHNGSKTVLALYSTPTVPGWTRHVGQQLRVAAPGGGLSPGIAFFGAPLPRWLAHTLASLFLHQDMVFLHHQERTVAAEQQRALAGGASAAAAATPKYYMPTSDDRGVTAWRSWLSSFAGGDVSYAPGECPHCCLR
ncbi:Pheophorbide a oxygenase, chloroplastic [Tetrabaena socialis]|uniref:Pheophorbide a oxygenase, chloroplastic n=1 Tax=Tetrabaena socialis TaxID=47790 RepID=A0A2J7ZT11_9CHLO|nr:Pheophorbide a oxygenase, chloroplastic [Tetrabaena socialis]|eukprot:PNH03405.1 Pheophorbide a oxygenase, chloroplastic [Tetrabaena socialis]